jgi:ankyrin repeat protein
MRFLAVIVATVAMIAACGDRPTPEPGALHEAAGAGDIAEVVRLLDAGAEVDAVDDSGRTPLVAAAYGAHLEVASVLIDAGADVNHQDASHQSAYLIATSEIGAGPGLELLRLTLAEGADVTALDSYNGTGLIRAAHRGHVDITRELLATDIDVDHVNRLAWTALLEAIILGDGGADHTEVVRLLLAAGADPNLADGDGVTPRRHARDRGFAAIERLLTDAGGHD